MIIRKAVSEDLPSIYKLVVELAIYEKEPDAVTATLLDYQQDFANGVFQCIVAEEAGDIAGIAIFFMNYSTWKGKMMYLEDFVVKQEQRKNGVGQLLFDAFLAEAKTQGCRLVKWQVLDWNEPALNFYKKNDAIIETNWWTGKLFLNE